MKIKQNLEMELLLETLLCLAECLRHNSQICHYRKYLDVWLSLLIIARCTIYSHCWELWVEPLLPVLSLVFHLCLLLLLLFHSFIGGANRVRQCPVVSTCRHYTQEISTSPAIRQGIHQSLRWYK